MTVHVYEVHDIFGKKKTQIIKQHTVWSYFWKSMYRKQTEKMNIKCKQWLSLGSRITFDFIFLLCVCACVSDSYFPNFLLQCNVDNYFKKLLFKKEK